MIKSPLLLDGTQHYTQYIRLVSIAWQTKAVIY